MNRPQSKDFVAFYTRVLEKFFKENPGNDFSFIDLQPSAVPKIVSFLCEYVNPLFSLSQYFQTSFLLSIAKTVEIIFLDSILLHPITDHFSLRKEASSVLPYHSFESRVMPDFLFSAQLLKLLTKLLTSMRRSYIAKKVCFLVTNKKPTANSRPQNSSKFVCVSVLFIYRCLTKNSNAEVVIHTSKPVCVELYKDYKDLGRFMLRYGGETIAAGVVTEVSSSDLAHLSLLAQAFVVQNLRANVS